MNHRQKSKQYGKWVFVKYPGDLAVYAVCQHCGFTYPCYRKEDGLIFVPDLKKYINIALNVDWKWSYLMEM